MRLWTIHPKYLDTKGLVALWREGLLAKAVLEGKTTGYTNHPQLIRFRHHTSPIPLVCQYLSHVLLESQARGYKFDTSKLPQLNLGPLTINATNGQLTHEWHHFLSKLKIRNPDLFISSQSILLPTANPIFHITDGPVESWEKSQQHTESVGFNRR